MPFQLCKEQHTEPLLLRVPAEFEALVLANTLYNTLHFSSATSPQQRALPWVLKVFCSHHYVALSPTRVWRCVVNGIHQNLPSIRNMKNKTFQINMPKKQRPTFTVRLLNFSISSLLSAYNNNKKQPRD